MDVVVVPSIWPENSPFVIHEAFLAGVPVVASRIGGIPELVEDGRNGLLFPVGDADRLASLIIRCYQDRPTRLRLAQAAQDSVRNREWGDVSQEIVNRVVAVA